MEDFNWNLGTDNAPEVSQNFALPGIAEPQAMSRRELRNRRAAKSAGGQRITASTAAEPLAELFQLTETTVTDTPTVSANPAVGSRRAARLAAAAATKAEPLTVESVTVESANVKSVGAGAAKSVKAKSVKATSVKRGKVPAETRLSRAVGHDRPSRKPTARRIGSNRKFFSKLFSVGTMVGIAAIMVSTSLPANAFYNGAGATSIAKATSSHAQSMKVASTVTESAVSRDAYTVSSLVEQLKLRYGSRNFNYTNDINGTIQWPFPVAVPISSGFGPRIAPCGGCSSVHEGVDFTPGRGVAIGSIADGVVSAVVSSHSGYGNHVIVDHVINGQLVQSVYGHMLDNSFTVAVGDHVTVTQKLGEVGSTGESTGPHLHLEIHINGVPVDPFAWLKANAN